MRQANNCRQRNVRSTGQSFSTRMRSGFFVSAQTDDDADKASSDDATGSLFAQELAKRGLNSSADIGADGRKESAEELLNRAAGRAPPQFTGESEGDDQLKRSRALNAEGIEGFPARAQELLKLGTTFFLSFGPLVGLTVGLVVVTYLVFGEEFIHQGPYEGYGAPPPYVEPYALLNEPTVDRMVPLITPDQMR